MSTDGVLGAAYLPTDGYIDPSQLTFALAEGARQRGAEIATNTRVTAIHVERGRVTGVATDKGEIETEVVVNAGGIFAQELGALAGVNVPIVPMAHEYLVTTPGRPAARHADDARPLAARLLPAGVGRARDGRLRARPRAVVARRHPARLQRPAARGGLAALRAVAGERRPPRPQPRGDGGRAADQRPRGVHTRRRVHPRADGRARLLGRGRVLRPRAGRAQAAWGSSSRNGSSRGRRVSMCGTWTRGASARRTGPRIHRRSHGRGLFDLLRRQVPGPRARGGTPSAPLARLSAARGARSVVRREVRLGARELVRAERRERGRVPAPPRLGRPALVARHRCRAPCVPRGGGALRRVVVREDRGLRRGRRRASRAALRQPGRAGRRCDHLHADAERAGRDRVRLHGHPAGCGALQDRDRHCLRPARSRLDPAARSRRRLGHRDRRHLRVCVSRALGARRRARSSRRSPPIRSTSGTCGRASSLSVPSRAWRSGSPTWASSAGSSTARRSSGSGSGTRSGRPAASTGWRRAATRRSTRSGSRRAIASGAPTSRRETRRTRPDSGLRSSSTRTSIGKDALLAAAEPERRLACVTLSDSHAVALGSEPVRVAGEARRARHERRLRLHRGRSIAYAYLPEARVEPGTLVEVEIFGEWVGGEVAAEPLYDPSGERLRA